MVAARILAVCLCCLTLAGPVRAEVAVAFVDAARLMREAPQVERIKARIREEFGAREQRIAALREQIRALETRLGGEKPMDEAQQRRLQEDVQSRRLQLQHERDELEQDKQLRFSEEEERFTRILHEVIAQVAQDRRLDLVLQSGVIWVSPRVDITDTVLERLRAMDGRP